MCYRNHKVYVSYTLSTHLFLCNLYATSVTNNSSITNSFIFTTSTFVILNRTEYTLTEKTVTLWFVRTVVNGFWFKHLSSRFCQNRLWRCQAYRNLIEFLYCVFFISCHNACMYYTLLNIIL